MADDLDLLRALFVPPTMRVACESAPPVRQARCGKCPFGGEDLLPAESAQAELLKAGVAGRMAAGETVVWGCHETLGNGKPQICAGFAEWTRERPELDDRGRPAASRTSIPRSHRVEGTNFVD